MKIIATLAFVSSGLFAAAQVTLTQSQFPQAGDVYMLNMADTAGVLPGSSGTGQTWNFSALNSAVGTMIDSFLNVGATPYGSTYPQANLALHETGPGIDYFVYYDENSASVDRVGNADTVNVITYTNPSTQFTYPLTYGTTNNDTYSAIYTDASSGSVVHVHGTGSSNADGTGALQLPASTYNNVLRVHYVRDELDTVFTSSGNLAYHETFNYYLWYIPGVYYPVLNILAGKIDIGFSVYYQKYVGWRNAPLGVAENSVVNSLSLFPNPAATQVQVHAPAAGTISLYAADGKLLFEQKTNGESTLDVSSFADGMVFVVFRNDEAVLRRTIVISH